LAKRKQKKTIARREPIVMASAPKKKKILIWGDSPTVNTGFGKVIKNLFQEANSKYDIGILGINENGIRKFDTKKWFIYPTDPTDPFGQKRLPIVLNDFKPDLIFLLQDIFNIETVLPIIKKSYGADVPIIAYFPVDGGPYSTSWSGVFAQAQIQGVFGPHRIVFDTTAPNVTKILSYSEFANNEMRKAFPGVEKVQDGFEVLYHGVDLDTYFPMEEEVVTKIREDLKWSNKFMLCCINRFQPRKQVSLLLKTVGLIVNGYKKCKCGNFYLSKNISCDLNMCGPEDVLEVVEPNILVGLYLHMNRNEIVMGPKDSPTAPLEAHASSAGFTQDHVNENLYLVNRNIIGEPYTEEELNALYNAANLNVSSAVGEGAGLSLLEASAAGTTSVAPRNSAIPEQIGDTGRLVSNSGFVNMAYDNAQFRPLVSIPDFVKVIEEEFDKWDTNGQERLLNMGAVERMRKDFNWEDKRAQLMNAIQEAFDFEAPL